MRNPHDWNALETRMLWAYDRTIDTLQRTDMVSDYLSAFLVRKGWFQVAAGRDAPVKAGPGQWLVAPAGNRVQEGSRPCSLVSVAFRAHWPDNSPLFDRGLPLRLKADTAPQLERYAVRLARELASAPPIRFGEFPFPVRMNMSRRSYLRIQSDFTRWLRILCDALEARGIAVQFPDSVDQRVMRAQHRLTHWASDAPPDFDRFAADLGMSRSTLERLFARHAGRTPYEYYNRARLQRARLLLRNPDTSVKAVALDTGFTDLAGFSHWFKRRTGLSPREYRQSPSR